MYSEIQTNDITSIPTRTNFETWAFTAGSHIAISLSLFLGSIVAAVLSGDDFTYMTAIAINGVLIIYLPLSSVISFFSSSIASQSGGHHLICIVGPMVGYAITMLLVDFFFFLMYAEGWHSNGLVTSSIIMQLCAALFGTTLAMKR